jgi:RimJ/RimL family protein N-acetyltransferase
VTPPAVTLRPLDVADVDVLMAHPDEGSPPGLQPTEEERRRRLERVVRRSPAFADGRLDLAVCIDGRLVGRVDARRPEGALPPGVVEIGIGLFTDARGRGVGRRAVELLLERLLAEHEIDRVQASTAIDNAAMRRVLERAGFALEGVLRAYMPDGRGGRVDYALYAITRGDHW